MQAPLRNFWVSCLALLAGFWVVTGFAQAQEPEIPKVDSALYSHVVSSGVNFLVAKGQDPQDGSFSKQLGPAVTAMCTTALIEHGLPLENQTVSTI